jgi:hypothetical protein
MSRANLPSSCPEHQGLHDIIRIVGASGASLKVTERPIDTCAASCKCVP